MPSVDQVESGWCLPRRPGAVATVDGMTAMFRRSPIAIQPPFGDHSGYRRMSVARVDVVAACRRRTRQLAVAVVGLAERGDLRPLGDHVGSKSSISLSASLVMRPRAASERKISPSRSRSHVNATLPRPAPRPASHRSQRSQQARDCVRRGTRHRVRHPRSCRCGVQAAVRPPCAAEVRALPVLHVRRSGTVTSMT